MSNIPADLKYTKSHEWVNDNANGTITVGITDHAQDALTGIVYVELPEVGASVSAGEVFGSVESVKSVSEIFAPLSGELSAVNEALVSMKLLAVPFDDVAAAYLGE